MKSWMDQRKGIGILCVLCLCAVLFWCFSSPGQASADTGTANSVIDTVSVSGKAEVKIAPDRCSVSVGVDLKEATAGEANSKLGSRSDAIIKALKAAGVKDEDIQTTYYSIDVDYKWTDNERKPTGYRGTCDLEVSGIAIDKVESIIDAAMGAGADSVGRVRYYCSTYNECYNDALTKAIKAARTKADKMGEAAGFKVIRVHSMTEGYQNESTKYVTNDVSFAEAASDSSAGASVAAGELTIEARVQVEYVIG